MSRPNDVFNLVHAHPTPLTSRMVANILGLEGKDAQAVAQDLAYLYSAHHIDRQPVSPERKGNRAQYEYMSLSAKESMPELTIAVDHHQPVVQEPLPEIEVPQPRAVASESIERLARLIGRRVARAMLESMREEFEEQLQEMTHSMIERWVDETARPEIRKATEQPSRPRLPKVLIAGLLPAQAGLIQQEFSDVFDLRFYMTDDNLKKLKGMLGSVDHVVTFTSKIEHQTGHMMAAAGHKIIRCSGGMTMLREKLEELFINSSEEKVS